jgi:phage shock protein PspC (stress-responsive transcriptional regulator)
MVFGVCGGLADYLRLDPALVRLGFVLITFAGGAGVLMYLILAIVLPVEDAPVPLEAAHGHTSRQLGAFVLIGLGLFLLASNLGALYGVQVQALWPLLLVVLGIGLIARRHEASS